MCCNQFKCILYFCAWFLPQSATVHESTSDLERGGSFDAEQVVQVASEDVRPYTFETGLASDSLVRFTSDHRLVRFTRDQRVLLWLASVQIPQGNIDRSESLTGAGSDLTTHHEKSVCLLGSHDGPSTCLLDDYYDDFSCTLAPYGHDSREQSYGSLRVGDIGRGRSLAAKARESDLRRVGGNSGHH